MPEYTITISSDGDKVLQKAYTSENATRAALGKATYKTMADFLTAQIEQEFGIGADELKALQQRDAVNAVVSKMTALPVEAIAEIAVAVDATASKYPGKP